MGEDTGQRIEVVETTDASLLEQAYRLRYMVSVEEMHKTVALADHARRQIRDELDDERSSVLCAVVDGVVIATLRLTWGCQNLPQSYHEQFSLHRFRNFPIEALSFTSRLVVHKDWRGTNALGLLFYRGYELARERGTRINFCHCTPALVRLYEQVGYRRYADALIDPDVGYHIPLLMLTEDVDHLRRVSSPLLRIARRLQNNHDTAAWFVETFPEYSLGGSLASQRSEEFVHSLAEQLFATGIPLFRGISTADTEKVIQASTVLKCKTGDHIVRRGDVGNEMFLILSGAAEVRRDAHERSYTIATLGEGEIFGEMAFLSSWPRTASIVAIADMEVLVLSQHFLKKLMKTLPETAMQVLFNLSLVLCSRLNQSNDQLLAHLSTDNHTA